MRIIGQRVLALVWVGLVCLAGAGQSRAAGSGKDGQGTMTVSPTSVNAHSTNNYLFSFRVPKNPFNSGSQATVQIPAGWAAPQTNNSFGPGFVSVTPVLSQSIASLNGISGTGPWTLSISFSTSQKQGGFNIDYQGAVAPTNAGIYSFLAQSRQNGGTLRTLRSGSPTVTVNSPTKTNTTTTLISSLNPSTYGNWVTFTATVTGSGAGTPTGTLTFLSGSVVMGISSLDAQGRATFTTNRFSVPDSPCWITAQYGGDSNFNDSVSSVLQQTVNPAALTLTGLAAQSKVYDAGSGAVLNASSANLGGVLAGDDVTLDVSGASAAFADPNAGVSKTVNVSGLALAGVDSGNYVLSPTATVTGDILPAPLTVTANDTNRMFGAPNPAFTATYSGFVAGEDASVLSGAPAFSSTAGPTSPPAGNPYPIVVTTGTLAAANYTFGFVAGSLTVLPPPNQPHQIVSITKLPGGAISLYCSGVGSQTYLLQASASLSPASWSNIATNTTDVSGFMTCLDPWATNFSSRFYRTAVP